MSILGLGVSILADVTVGGAMDREATVQHQHCRRQDTDEDQEELAHESAQQDGFEEAVSLTQSGSQAESLMQASNKCKNFQQGCWKDRECCSGRCYGLASPMCGRG